MKIINCKRYHLEEVVEVFLQAFKKSIYFFVIPNSKVKRAFKDIFNLLLNSYPEGFFLAADKNGRVSGYILVVPGNKLIY